LGDVFLLSPSENELAEKLEDEAVTSALPEQKGADILLYTSMGIFGWQRKKVPTDFITSVTDGRFARLLPLLTKSCVFYRVIKEGKFTYWPDGTVFLGMTKGRKKIPTRFTRKHVHGILNDIEVVWNTPIRDTEDIDDTVMYLRSVREFLRAKTHVGLYNRPKVQGTWYVPTANETQLWILQGFGGIGPSTADKIIKHFGQIPIRWTCSAEELAQISGITVKKANDLICVLNALPGAKQESQVRTQRTDATQPLTDIEALRRMIRHG